MLAKTKTQRHNIDSFLVQVKKYTEVKELDAETIRVLVEHIDVFKPKKSWTPEQKADHPHPLELHRSS